jgi:hypothetical protein
VSPESCPVRPSATPRNAQYSRLGRGGGSFGCICLRITEFTPSAPINTSPDSLPPLFNLSVTPSAFSENPARRFRA